MLICLYWGLVIFGGGYILLTFLIGELSEIGEQAFESLGDTISHAWEGIFGAGEAAQAADLGGDIAADTGPGLLSFQVIIMFGAGFGAGGLVGNGMGLSDPLTLLPAFGFGLVAGSITWAFLRFLYRQQASTSVQPADYAGLIGRVTVSIPEGRLGQVIVEIKLQKKLLPARSEHGRPIAAQSTVEVVSMEGGTLIVRALS